MRNIAIQRKNDTEVDRLMTTMATDKILKTYKNNQNIPTRKDVEHVVREQTNKGKFGLALNHIDEKNVDYYKELRDKFHNDKTQVSPHRLRSYVRRSLKKHCLTRKLQLKNSGLFRISNLIEFLLHNSVKIIFAHHCKTVANVKQQQRLLPKSVGSFVVNDGKTVYLEPSDVNICANQVPALKKLLHLTL